jgi:hypothetical protein
VSVSGAIGNTTSQQYTGCLSNGTISQVNVGTSPLKACAKGATQISWSQTGPQGTPGSNGTNGTNGTNGQDGSSVTNTALGSGDANCPNGGAKFTVASGAATYACNGAVGAKGDKGDQGPTGPALVSVDSLSGVACGNGTGTITVGYASDGTVTLKCVTNSTSGGGSGGNGGTGCGTAPDYPNGSAVCNNGAFVLVCNAGYADVDGLVSNGCEVNLATDPSNCGSVGNNVANLPNATGGCVNGTAKIVACHSGYFDANNIVADGCESQLPNCESVMHFDGIGNQTFVDCTPLGAYSLTLAHEAANRWAQGHGNVSVTDVQCKGDLAVVASDTATWVTWDYQGTAQGHVTTGTGAASNASCPTTADPTWE